MNPGAPAAALDVVTRGPDLANAAGAPVVLLHSSGLSARQWSRLARALAPDHRVLMPNFAGYGASPPVASEASYSWRDDAGAIAPLLASLSAPVHLVGHSYGGLVALRVALDRAQELKSLVVYEPVAFGVLHTEADAEGLADLAHVDGDAFSRDEGGGDEAWLTRFVDYWSGDGAFAALPDAARASWLAVGRKAFLEVRSLLRDRTPLDAYRTLDVPTLLLSGDASRAAARRTCELLARAMPRARHEHIHGLGHMGPITHVEAVNARILDHIRANA